MSAKPFLLSITGVGFSLFGVIFFASNIGNANSQIDRNNTEMIDACQTILRYGGNHDCDVQMADFHNNCNHATWKPDYCKDPRVDNYLRARGYL